MMFGSDSTQSTGNKQPVSLLFVDQLVENVHWFNMNSTQRVVHCIGKR